jgi:hypothetical protein
VVTVPAAPPPPADSSIAAVSPGADYVYVSGYYDWNGRRYVWVPGAWVRASRPASTWVPAHWEPTTGGYRWAPGSWQ